MFHLSFAIFASLSLIVDANVRQTMHFRNTANRNLRSQPEPLSMPEAEQIEVPMSTPDFGAVVGCGSSKKPKGASKSSKSCKQLKATVPDPLGLSMPVPEQIGTDLSMPAVPNGIDLSEPEPEQIEANIGEKVKSASKGSKSKGNGSKGKVEGSKSSKAPTEMILEPLVDEVKAIAADKAKRASKSSKGKSKGSKGSKPSQELVPGELELPLAEQLETDLSLPTIPIGMALSTPISEQIKVTTGSKSSKSKGSSKRSKASKGSKGSKSSQELVPGDLELPLAEQLETDLSLPTIPIGMELSKPIPEQIKVSTGSKSSKSKGSSKRSKASKGSKGSKSSQELVPGELELPLAEQLETDLSLPTIPIGMALSMPIPEQIKVTTGSMSSKSKGSSKGSKASKGSKGASKRSKSSDAL